jgi:hypothetical protein
MSCCPVGLKRRSQRRSIILERAHATGESDHLYRAAHCRHRCPLTEGLHLTEPPLEITSSLVSMVWHARADRDPGHIWLRNNITRICAANPCLVPTRKQSDRSIETKLPSELPVTA